MTKNWDAYKSVIVGEYKDNNKALHEVQRIMESKYNFKASCVLPLFSSSSRRLLAPTHFPHLSFPSARVVGIVKDASAARLEEVMLLPDLSRRGPFPTHF